jgi:hypothetical protein
MAAPFPRKPTPTVCQPWSCYASPYSGWQTVIYHQTLCEIGAKLFLKNGRKMNKRLDILEENINN